MRLGLPILDCSTRSCSSRGLVTAWPANCRITSPGFTPALAAGVSSRTSVTSTPWWTLTLNCSASGLRDRLDDDAQVGAVHLAVLLQLSADPLGQVDGDGEADALVAAGVGRNGRVDADDLAVEIHQRAAAVAGIDGRVGLDEILAVGDADAASLGADDAGRDGAFQSEGLAEGQHPIADFDLVAVAQPGGGQRAGAVDADDGQVGLGIGLDVDGLEFPPVVQADRDLSRRRRPRGCW